VIDDRSDSVIGVIKVDSCPSGMCYNPTNNRIYCANPSGRSVDVIDCFRDTVIKSIGAGWAGQNRTSICYDPANNRVYVADSDGCSYFAVIDCALDSETAWTDSGHCTGILTCNSRDGKIYCASTDDDCVTIISADSNEIITSDTVGGNPLAECYDAASDKVFVTSLWGRKVTAIDGRTDGIVATVGVGGQPVAMALVPALSRLYVANPSQFSVAVLGTEGGIQERNQFAGKSNPLEVWPNPCRGVLHVRAAATSANSKPKPLEIYDATGRRVMNFNLKPGAEAALDLRRFASGVYFLWSATTPSLPAMSETLHSTYKVILTR
jgi:DNA-binding beta-propeller fold protein YncE